jgi:hypothetical protein
MMLTFDGKRIPSALRQPSTSTTDCAHEMMDTMDRGSLYEHDIPSLSASLEAFNPERDMYPSCGGRSMHSSAWPESQEEVESDTESEEGWAPPGWQKSQSSNNWHRRLLLDDRTDRDVTPSHIPLPESPYKQTPRASPEPIPEEERFMQDSIASRIQSLPEEPQSSAGAQQGNQVALSQPDETGPVEGCE